MPNLGKIGEELVAQWLSQQEYSIVAHRWRCRRGEIDIIALLREEVLAFVEVKTRSQNNWDADGLLAITAKKQSKLSQTALFFLAQYPNLSSLICRFDVALVKVDNALPSRLSPSTNITQIQLGKSLIYQGYQLTLLDYLESAFDQPEYY